MNPIYAYTDFRTYLKDYYEEKKSSNTTFSYGVFAKLAQFKARDYILRVINGSRNLSKSGIVSLSKAMRLSEKEASYFENLVFFNQAKKADEKAHFYHQLNSVNRYGKYQKLREDQYEYFSQWHTVALRSLLPVMDFGKDFRKIGKFLDPPISAKSVEDSVKLLLRIGLLQETPEGGYAVGEPNISTGDELRSLALADFQKTMAALAVRSINIHQPDERDISGVTMSLSLKGFGRLKSELQAFRKKVMDIARQDSQEDRVCQLSIHLFPLSKTSGKSL